MENDTFFLIFHEANDKKDIFFLEEIGFQKCNQFSNVNKSRVM